MSSPDPDDVSKFLTASVKAHPLDRFVNRVINKLVDSYIVPWLFSCFRKYTEVTFHQRMADPNFDFLVDWKTYHVNFNKFISGARKFRHRYKFEVDDALQKVIVILKTQAGWTVYPQEIPKLRKTIQDVHDEIYNDPL